MESSIITKKPDLSKFSKFVKSRLDETPVIVDNKDHVRVGNYVCRQDSGQWTVSRNNEILEQNKEKPKDEKKPTLEETQKEAKLKLDEKIKQTEQDRKDIADGK